MRADAELTSSEDEANQPKKQRNKRRRRLRKHAGMQSPYAVLTERPLVIRREDRSELLETGEAMEQKIMQLALDGDKAARRLVHQWIAEHAEAAGRSGYASSCLGLISCEPEDPSNADAAMLLLGIATEDVSGREEAGERQLLLVKWAVDAALARRRGPPLTKSDKFEVRRCTNQADQIRWPSEEW
jgi:hypothetical protein